MTCFLREYLQKKFHYEPFWWLQLHLRVVKVMTKLQTKPKLQQ